LPDYVIGTYQLPHPILPLKNDLDSACTEEAMLRDMIAPQTEEASVFRLQAGFKRLSNLDIS
jgi:hypothetical protein